MYAPTIHTAANNLARMFKGVYNAAYHRFYIDEIYQFFTHKIIFKCISTPVAWFDHNVVDGFMNMLAWSTQNVSIAIRGLQSGSIQQYTYVFLLGILVIILFFIL